MNPKKKRPVGITLLAILFIFIAFTKTVWNPIIGISSDADLWQQFAARIFHSASLLRITSSLFPPLTYLFFGAWAVVGFGLWSLRNWSRRTVFVLIGFACTIGIWFERPLVNHGLWAHATFVPWSLSYIWWILPFLWIAWYLTRPRVCFAFGVWPSAACSDPMLETPPGISKEGKIWVALSLVASFALFVCEVMIG